MTLLLQAPGITAVVSPHNIGRDFFFSCFYHCCAVFCCFALLCVVLCCAVAVLCCDTFLVFFLCVLFCGKIHVAFLESPLRVSRKPVEYTETIEPTTIARRLMEIREQMAEQLSTDLQQMAAENAKLQRDYVDEVRRSIPQLNS